MRKEAFFKISYGLYIVSSHLDGKLNGQIANTVFQVTSQPPKFAVCINKENLTHKFIAKSKVFCASVLAKTAPMSLIGRFGFKSGREIDKFNGVKCKIGKTGSPVVLDSTLAYLEAKVVDQLDVGSHTLFIGEVVDADILVEGEPMTYAFYHQVKKGLSPRTAPTFIEEATKEEKEVNKMKKFRCKVCGYVYDPQKGDPDNGVEPGTPFEALPEEWVCPVCGAAKEEFESLEE